MNPAMQELLRMTDPANGVGWDEWQREVRPVMCDWLTDAGHYELSDRVREQPLSYQNTGYFKAPCEVLGVRVEAGTDCFVALRNGDACLIEWGVKGQTSQHWRAAPMQSILLAGAALPNVRLRQMAEPDATGHLPTVVTVGVSGASYEFTLMGEGHARNLLRHTLVQLLREVE